MGSRLLLSSFFLLFLLSLARTRDDCSFRNIVGGIFFLLHFRFICVKISVTSPPPPHNRLSRELLRDNLSINVPDARVEHNQPIRILRKETRNEKSSVDEFFKLILFFKLEERKKLLIL